MNCSAIRVSQGSQTFRSDSLLLEIVSPWQTRVSDTLVRIDLPSVVRVVDISRPQI